VPVKKPLLKIVMVFLLNEEKIMNRLFKSCKELSYDEKGKFDKLKNS